MSQPTAPTKFNVVITDQERELIYAFLNAGLKAEINRVGLSGEASIITSNALFLAEKFQKATPVLEVLDTPANPANP